VGQPGENQRADDDDPSDADMGCSKAAHVESKGPAAPSATVAQAGSPQ
jgi:hypothetical protein